MAMDFDRIASELDSASLFDLYRLHVAVGKMLDDPARIVRVKYALRPGQQVRFLDERGQRLVGARVLQVKQTRATVEELATGKHWVIPLFVINVDGAEVCPAAPSPSVGRDSLRVGDAVAFTGRDGQTEIGTVVKLNPRRAKVRVGPTVWAVPYALLSPVIEGERSGGELIPAGD